MRSIVGKLVSVLLTVLLNHLIRLHQRPLRDRQADLLRGLEIDLKLELCQLLHGGFYPAFRTFVVLIIPSMERSSSSSGQ